MDEYVAYVPLQKINASDLNKIQRMIHNSTIGSEANSLSTMAVDRDNYDFVAQPINVAAGTDVVLDKSVNWRNRYVKVTVTIYNNATDIIGGGVVQEPYANQYLETAQTQRLYTGKGSDRSNVPLDRSLADYYIDDPAGGIYQVFADSNTGDLYIRNNSGVTRHYLVEVEQVIGLS